MSGTIQNMQEIVRTPSGTHRRVKGKGPKNISCFFSGITMIICRSSSYSLGFLEVNLTIIMPIQSDLLRKKHQIVCLLTLESTAARSRNRRGAAAQKGYK